MFQRILLGWDGSDVAVRALDVAIDLGRRYDVELVALSVAYSPAHAETDADREESSDAAARYLTDTFVRVRDRADRAGVGIEHVVVSGDEPTDVLLAYCHEHGFDLVVVGHHRSGRSGRLLLHDVARKLLGVSAVPVLVVGERER